MALAQGSRVSKLVPFPNRQCSSNDYVQDFVCDGPVHHQQNSNIEEFLWGIGKEAPLIKFGDIHVSEQLWPDSSFYWLMQKMPFNFQCISMVSNLQRQQWQCFGHVTLGRSSWQCNFQAFPQFWGRLFEHSHESILQEKTYCILQARLWGSLGTHGHAAVWGTIL